MEEIIQVVKSDGSVRFENAFFLEPEPEPYVPTTEERIAALEAAMLSMMGVSTDV